MTTTNNIVIIIKNKSFRPVIIYNNINIEKSKIFSDNKGKAGIYLWTCLDSNKIYIGSAVDLSKRIRSYFSKTYLTRSRNSHITNALIKFGYSAFSLTIIEYIDISNLSKEEARKLILGREQYYINYLEPEFNILKVAGSSLGFKHSEETKLKLNKIRSGVNHPLFGKSHSPETLALMSKALSGQNHPLFGKPPSANTKSKLSIAKGIGIIYVYNIQGSLAYTFCSARKAAEHFKSSHPTIIRYVKNGKLFQDKWRLSTIENSSA